MSRLFSLVGVIVLLCALANAGKIMVPAYFYPSTTSGVCTDANFIELASQGSCVIAIVNPANGPGTSLNSDYDICLDSISTAGNQVFGYVYSGYGSRSMSAIETDIDRWQNYYGDYLSGIFVDETVTFWQIDSTNEAFYDDIFDYIKSTNAAWEIIINPGTVSPSQFVDGTNVRVDYAVMFENDYDRYDPATALSNPSASCEDNLWTTSQGTFGPGPWCPLVPNWDGVNGVIDGVDTGSFSPTKFVTMIYDGSDYASAWSLASAVGVDVFYMTDDILSNPWDTLPSYFSDMADEVCEL